MNTLNLATLLAKAGAGAEVHITAGEFEGPWVIERPVRLIGDGSATVLWARQGPVLTIRSPDVHLQNLAVEVTEDEEGTALFIDNAVADRPPQFSKVRVLGKAEGLQQNQRWRVPAVIDLGRISPRPDIQKTVGLEVPKPVTVRPELIGLIAIIQELKGGRQALQLTLDGTGLIAGYLLEGRLEIEACGLITRVRVTGQVIERQVQPTSAEPAVKAPHALDLLTQGGQQPDRLAQNRREAPARTGAGGTPGQSTEPALPPGERKQVETLLQDARQATESNDLAKASELLNQAIKLQPDQVELHVELAVLYSKGGNFVGAAQEWQRVLGLDPKHATVHVELGRCFNQLNHFDDAIVLLEKLLRDSIRQNDVVVYRVLAVAYYNVERRAEAFWALDRAQQIRFDPKLLALRKAWEQDS